MPSQKDKTIERETGENPPLSELLAQAKKIDENIRNADYEKQRLQAMQDFGLTETPKPVKPPKATKTAPVEKPVDDFPYGWTPHPETAGFWYEGEVVLNEEQLRAKHAADLAA